MRNYLRNKMKDRLNYCLDWKKNIDIYLANKEVLEKTGVAIAPGRDFGLGAEGYIRISYANSMENIERALTKIAESGLL